MADRGRVGSLVTASRRCQKRLWMQEHEAHRQRIRQVKASTDHSTPLTAETAPVKNNLKLGRILEERYGEIDRDNGILLKKIKENMKKKADFFQPGPENLPTSLNIQQRKKDMIHVMQENERMLKAMKDTKPVYNNQRLMERERVHLGHLKNCAQYPLVLRKQRSAPSLLVAVQEAPSPNASALDSMFG
eukprot:TRINITY_DN15829_c0_g1_i1.p1 TRINITY_DN15829_c0_g1~~TRINITY_DN15829_c0_g1_i1.p1  ORF type:complete len:189 (+),score=49.65 TRINITY_DN15829_c0_g1_i1:208-774(+)